MSASRKVTKTHWRTLSILGAVLAIGALGYGLSQAAQSPLFLVQVVEIGNLPENSPVDEAELTRLADVPVGKVSLFQLDLSQIEQRIRANPWIREARIQKRFPETVSIFVSFREPRALIAVNAINGEPQGSLAYVDQEAHVFGHATTQAAAIYPVLTGVSDPARIKQTLKFLDAWDQKMKDTSSELASLSYNPERGFRALVTYPLAKPQQAGGRGRATIELGQNIDDAEATPPQLERLSRVLGYLSVKSIAARQIWADSGKKIVVRTARGS